MKKTTIILVPLFLIGGLTLCFVYLAPSLAQSIAFNRLPEEEQAGIRAEYQDWLTHPIHLPDSALHPAPFTTQTVAAVRRFEEAWEKYGAQATKFTKPYQYDDGQFDPTIVNPALKEYSPLLDAFIAVIQRPDYELTALLGLSRHNYEAFPTVAFKALAPCKELLRLKARSAANARRWPEAFEAAELMARATHTHPYAFIIVQLLSLSMRGQAVDLWSDLVTQCDDAALLRRALDAQNALASQMNYFGDSGIPLMALDKISGMREVRRAGVAANYQDKTGRELAQLAPEAIARLWETVTLPSLKASPAQAANMQKRIADYRLMAKPFKANDSSIKLPFIYISIRHGSSNRRDTIRACRDKLDQLRLQTARKLYRLENGKAPASDSALGPRYLPSPVAVPPR
jgi:hypothetical protein